MEAPEPIDLRDLPPPEPMVRVLDALGQGGGPFHFLLPMQPRLLLPILERSGWRYEVLIAERGVELKVMRKP